MIEVSRVIFDYPGTRALDDVSFSVERGAILALVGPNGAGKTTLLSCLAGLETPFSGGITIDGIDVMQDPRACHRKVGYLADFFGLYQDLTVEQCLRYACRVHEVSPDKESVTVNTAAKRLGISDRMHMRARELSRGLRQRLAVAQVIVHDPLLLLLDEPASGLDPEARHELSQLFLELQEHGMTLIVSSHILAELDEYSTDMLILRNGKIIETQHLREQQQNSATMRVIFSSEPDDIEALFANIDGIHELSKQGTEVRFRCASDAALQHTILKHLIQQGAPVCSFAQERINLQDTYMETLKS